MITLSLLATLASTQPTLAQDARVPMDTGWTHLRDSRVENFRGQSVIRITAGMAIKRDVSLQDGTIEFDLMVTREPSFVSVAYRMASDEDFEMTYFRPHKSALTDAVQYTPVWRGEANWQLYHGPGSTARLTFKPGEWMHVRLVLEGRRGALFVGTDTAPVLLMSLARDAKPGYFGFAVDPGRDTTGLREPLARFANLVIRKGAVQYRFPPEARPSVREGLVTRWQLSPPFEGKPGPMEAIPDSALTGRTSWPEFSTEPNGVLVVGRYLPKPRGPSGVIARLVVRAPTEGFQRLHLGFSDCVTVFVNGHPVFAGDARFSNDNPRQEGVIGEHQALVWLPLKTGENEILLALTEIFGGRGLIGRLEPADGARLVFAPPR
jgi:hypothetical protein